MWLLGIVLLVLLAGCDGSTDAFAFARASHGSEPLAGVEHSGCLVVDAAAGSARCELEITRHLTFWVAGAPRLLVRSDRRPLRWTAQHPVDGGVRYELHVAPGTRRLELQATDRSGRFVLELSEPLTAPALERARVLRESGELSSARAILEAASHELSGPLQRRAAAQLARLRLATGDAQGAAEGLARSFEAALTLGRPSEALHDATALAFVLATHLRSYARARALLERLPPLAARDPAGAALLPHYEGVLALETGDLRGALVGFREAARRTRRLGLREHELLAREQEAGTLVLLGRHAEAVATQREIADGFPSRDACQRADREESVVWFGLLAEPDPTGELAAIVRRYATRSGQSLEACPSPWRRRNHVVNAALFALQQGNLPRAGHLLAELERTEPVDDPVLTGWELELRGRHALAVGRPARALAHYQRALAASERSGLWDNRQLAQLGIGRSLERLGRAAAAIEAYFAGERLLDRGLAVVPLGEGQAGFRHAREGGTRELIELLLREGDPARALAVARRARARGLVTLAAAERSALLDGADRARWEEALERYHGLRARIERLVGGMWQLPGDQVEGRKAEVARAEEAARDALDEGYAVWMGRQEDADLREHERGSTLARSRTAEDGVVAYFPLGPRLQGFVVACGQARSLALPLPMLGQSASELGRSLLAPFSGELACASRLRVIVPASLSWLDVGAFVVDGQAALERWTITYSADVPLRRPSLARSGALLVADPRGDLPSAAAEMGLQLPASTAPVVRLSGSEARRGVVLSELGRVSLFHYAGHHRFAGIEGSDSELVLADGAISLGDVLTLPQAPALVVLSACEGATLDAPGFAGGLDIAHAFIVAGADEVVAATRPVSDALAHGISSAFYVALARNPTGGAGEALRSAQRSTRELEPQSDWSAFRVLTR